MIETPIYFDYSSTTPVDPEVLESMLPFLRGDFESGIRSHLYGWKAEEAVENASQVASLVRCDSRN